MRKQKAVRVWPKQLLPKTEIVCSDCGGSLKVKHITYTKNPAIRIVPCEGCNTMRAYNIASQIVMDNRLEGCIKALQTDLQLRMFDVINEAWKEFKRRLDLTKK